MVLRGHISADGDGLSISVRAMMTQLAIYNVHTDNIANFGIPGYQRKDPIVTSFAEYLGPNAVDKKTSTEIGRIRQSGNPMDLALNTKGYFQFLNATGGIDLTRDGRIQIDKDGYLRSLEGKQMLSAAGSPIQLTTVPQDIEKQFKVSPNGDIKVYDFKTGKIVFSDHVGIAAEDGSAATTVDLKQGFVEDSNVFLQNEYVSIMPLRRQFEANRQLFIMQSDTLSRMIQELGRTQ